MNGTRITKITHSAFAQPLKSLLRKMSANTRNNTRSNAIQKNTTGASYNVYVRMNDGRTTVVTQRDLGNIREGSYVRVHDGKAWAQ